MQKCWLAPRIIVISILVAIILQILSVSGTGLPHVVNPTSVHIQSPQDRFKEEAE